MTQAELARRIGIQQPSVAAILSGKAKGTRYLHRIARVLETTPEWLLGETDDPNAPPHRLGEASLAFRGPEPEGRQPARPDLLSIREIDLTLGFGSTYLDIPVTETVHDFPRDWIRQYTKAKADQLLFAQGVGDSMQPTLYDSDLLLIDCSQQTLNMADKIWAIAFGEVGGVKRLRPLPGGGVQILSDNPNVPDATAYDGELHILGRVVAVVRKM